MENKKLVLGVLFASLSCGLISVSMTKTAKTVSAGEDPTTKDLWVEAEYCTSSHTEGWQRGQNADLNYEVGMWWEDVVIDGVGAEQFLEFAIENLSEEEKSYDIAMHYYKKDGNGVYKLNGVTLEETAETITRTLSDYSATYNIGYFRGVKLSKSNNVARMTKYTPQGSTGCNGDSGYIEIDGFNVKGVNTEATLKDQVRERVAPGYYKLEAMDTFKHKGRINNGTADSFETAEWLTWRVNVDVAGPYLFTFEAATGNGSDTWLNVTAGPTVRKNDSNRDDLIINNNGYLNFDRTFTVRLNLEQGQNFIYIDDWAWAGFKSAKLIYDGYDYTKLEAETGTLLGGARVSAYIDAIYSGTGFLDNCNNPGDGFEVTYNAPAAGTYLLKLTAAHGDGSNAKHTNDVYINGDKAGQFQFNNKWNWFQFRRGTDLPEFTTDVMPVNLVEGANKIRVSIGEDGHSIAYDKLEITGDVNTQMANVVSKIDAIGEVELTQECKDKIDAARESFDGLVGFAATLFDNTRADALTAAESTYADLQVTAEEANKVKLLIEAIDVVAYTQECKDKIDAARTAYNALSDAAKSKVDNYETLTTAESTYADLVATSDAANVDQLIDEIGTVEFTKDCKDKIDAARTSYDELSELAKSKVTKLDVLTAAEDAYAVLQQASAQCKAFYDALDAIDEFESPTQTALTQITAARNAYNLLSELSKSVIDPDAISYLEELENSFNRLLSDMISSTIKSLKEVRDTYLEDEYMLRESILIDAIYWQGIEAIENSKYAEEIESKYDATLELFGKILTAEDVAQDVLEARTQALEKLASVIDFSNYSSTNYWTVYNAYANCVTALSEATTVDQVNMILVNALTQILVVPTLKETSSYNLAYATDYYAGYVLYLVDGLDAEFVTNKAMFEMTVNSYVGRIYAATSVTEAKEIFEEFYVYFQTEFYGTYSDYAVMVKMVEDYTALLQQHLEELLASGYRTAEATALNSIVEGAIEDFEYIIDFVEYYSQYYYGVAASNLEIVTQTYEAAIAAMNAVKTEAQYVAEELAQGKQDAVVALEEYAPIANYNINRTSYQEVMEKAVAEINSASSLNAVAKALNDAKNALNEIRNDEMAEAAVASVNTLIAAIGKVDATTECGAKIATARDAYEALTRTEKYLVEGLETLVSAEADYAACVEAAPAIKVINAIGEVEYKLSCKIRIDDAREAYDALSEAAKAQVSAETLAVLTDAEEKYASLKETEHQVGCAGSIAAASGIITLVTLLGAGLLASKRKED